MKLKSSIYKGKQIYDYENDHKEINKDSVMKKLLPGVSACPIGMVPDSEGSCLGPPIKAKLEKNEKYKKESGSCQDDLCRINVGKKVNAISPLEAKRYLKIYKKPSGPTGNELFSDATIHGILFPWMYRFLDFYAYNFNMLNFRQQSLDEFGNVLNEPDTLETVPFSSLRNRLVCPKRFSSTEWASLEKLKAGKIRTSACIINSDVYTGTGKHWMALFVDIRTSPATVEFFNSAAIMPERQWLYWLNKTKGELEQDGYTVNVVPVCQIWHQHSRTECGPYSVFYVWARLNGISPQYFIKNPVPDQLMFDFRSHLFSKEPFDYSKVRPIWDSNQEAIIGEI